MAGPEVSPGFEGGAAAGDWPNARVPAAIAINNKNRLVLREPNSELRSLNGRRFDLTLNIQSSFFRNPPFKMLSHIPGGGSGISATRNVPIHRFQGLGVMLRQRSVLIRC